MKKTILVIAFFITLNTYAQKQPPKTNGTVPPVKLATSADSMQYVLGAFMGLWLTNNGFVVNNQALFLRGFEDIFQNRTRIIPDSVIALRVTAYQEAAQKGLAAQQEQQLFASMKDKPGIGMFPNGVRYIVLKTGKGARPLETDSIVLHLTARLINGTVVEDTYQTKKPFETRPAAFFPGLNDALQMMSEGSKWQLFIPSVLAYGDKGTAMIPPHSALIIEAELVEVRPVKK
jgi:FKBP-type peptidyl-prolyl cis-trans isomerase FklB